MGGQGEAKEHTAFGGQHERHPNPVLLGGSHKWSTPKRVPSLFLPGSLGNKRRGLVRTSWAPFGQG